MVFGEIAAHSAEAERHKFAARLTQALETAGHDKKGPTEIAKLLYARSKNSVTPHAVRKWLLGESIPRQENIETIAAWLGCDTAWLRFGHEEVAKRPAAIRTNEDLSLLHDLALLPPEIKEEIKGFVAMMLAAGGKA